MVIGPGHGVIFRVPVLSVSRVKWGQSTLLVLLYQSMQRGTTVFISGDAVS